MAGDRYDSSEWTQFWSNYSELNIKRLRSHSFGPSLTGELGRNGLLPWQTGTGNEHERELVGTTETRTYGARPADDARARPTDSGHESACRRRQWRRQETGGGEQLATPHPADLKGSVPAFMDHMELVTLTKRTGFLELIPTCKS